MAPAQKKNQSIETHTHIKLTVLIKVIDKDIRIAFVNMVKKIKENLTMINRKMEGVQMTQMVLLEMTKMSEMKNTLHEI